MRPAHHHTVQISLDALRPTQATIGFAEVREKRAEWAALSKKARKLLLASHWFPAVIGPQGQYFIVDHHHLGMALHEAGQREAQLTVLQDFSSLDKATFWRVMEFHQWVHPYDENARRIDFSALPRHVSELRDDPYRSLAGLTRKAGGFAKDVTPFSEFLWADYFRPRIKVKLLRGSLAAQVERACELARRPEASYLPGWVGEPG